MTSENPVVQNAILAKNANDIVSQFKRETKGEIQNLIQAIGDAQSAVRVLLENKRLTAIKHGDYGDVDKLYSLAQKIEAALDALATSARKIIHP